MGQRVWWSGRAREQGGPGTDRGRTGSKFVLASAIINVTAAGHGLGRGGRRGGGEEGSDQGGAVAPRVYEARRSKRSSSQIRARIRQWVKGHTTQIAAAALRQARIMLLLQARYKAGSCVPSAGAGRGQSRWWWWWWRWYSTGTSQRPNSQMAK